MVLLDVILYFRVSDLPVIADRNFSNLPIGAAVFCLVVLGLKLKMKKDPLRDLPAMEKLKSLDPLGIALLLGAVSCLFLALQWGGSRFPWSSSRIIGCMIGFGLLIITFGVLQWRLAEHATIPLRILKQRTVFFGAVALFFISMSSNTVSIPALDPVI